MPRRRPALVVGVAASAGGVAALRALLHAVPPDTDLAFLVVQHHEPAAPSLLAEILDHATPVRVADATDGAPLDAGVVLVAPPGHAMTANHQAVRLERIPPAEVRSLGDRLFRSLADAFGERAAAVVLSGTGSDGCTGVRAVHAAGGVTVAQRPEEALQPGMPRAAIDTGAVDLVLEAAAVHAGLARMARALGAPEAVSPEAIARVGALLSEDAPIRLEAYRTATVARRLLRRVGLSHEPDVEAYLDRLGRDPSERAALRRDVLVGVTAFFRDPEVFAVLRERAVPALLEALGPGEPVRAWVAACSTGEEAYSIAIQLLDGVAAGPHPARDVRVFATDIDADSLGVARRGRYGRTIRDQVPPDDLARWFEPEDDGFVVGTALRKAVSFAQHDLSSDPPFGGIHLASCRNLLIYLKPTARKRALDALAFALRPGGLLVLGRSEAIGEGLERFAEVDPHVRLYRRLTGGRPSVAPRRTARLTPPERRRRDSATEAARDALLDHQPPSVVVGADGEILYTVGDVGTWLHVPPGEPVSDLVAMLRPSIADRVRTLLLRTRRGEEPVRAMVDDEGGTRIVVCPAPRVGAGAAIVRFEPAPRPPAVARSEDEPALRRLEADLVQTRQDLQAAVTELEETRAELRASTDEGTAVTEELEAANEELEASGEELRALNEQLQSVNSTLLARVAEVERARDDLDNLLASTDIAVLFLDRELRVRHLTPAARSLLRLSEGDLGRPVEDIAREPLQLGLVEEARGVLDHDFPAVREVALSDGRWASRRVGAYRTGGREVAGVVVAFVDVTELKRTSEWLRERVAQQRVIARLGLRALEEPGLDELLGQLVREVGQTLDVEIVKLVERQPGDLLVLRAGTGFEADHLGALVESGVDTPAGYVLVSGESLIVEDLASDRRFDIPELLRDRGAVSGIGCVVRGDPQPYGVLAAYSTRRRTFSVQDTTFLEAVANVLASAIERRRTRQRIEIERAVATLVAAASSLDEAAPALLDTLCGALACEVGELWEVYGDRLGRSVLRVQADAARGGEIRAALADVDMARGEGIAGRAWATGEPQVVTRMTDPALFARAEAATALGLRSAIAFPVRSDDETHGVVLLLSSASVSPEPMLLQALEAAGHTVAEAVRRSRAEAAVREAEARKSAILAASLDAVVTMDHGGRILEWSPAAEALFGAPAAEVVGTDMADRIIPPALRDAHRRGLARYLETGEGPVVGRRLRLPALRSDGSEFPAEIAITRIELPGPPVFTGFVRDVTDAVAAERALRASEARFREVLERSPWPMLVYDDAGTVVVTSRTWTAYGGPAEAGTVEDFARAVLGDGARELGGRLAALWDAEEPVAPWELEVRGPEGAPRTLLVGSTPLSPLPDGRRLRTLAAADITDQKRAQESLRRADQQKDTFLAMLGHELRNPLAAIRSTAQLLEQLPLGDGPLQRARGVLLRQSAHMAELVDGLLDVSRIARGKLEVAREVVDLGPVLEATVGDRAAEVRACGLVLDFEPAHEALCVRGDAVRLAQVVDNLVSNAIKFTDPPGTITVRAARAGDMAELVVSDTGIGIAPELLPYVFEPFRQGEQTLDRPRGGLGLGLSLVKGVVELLGGHTEAHSEGPGRGSTFRVHLPLVAEAELHEPAPVRAEGGARLLVVEDNADAARVLQDLLELVGHVVKVASDGPSAMAAARAFRPDVVLCDIGLPGGMSGYDVAREMRADAALAGMRLVAITGYGMPEDVRRAQEAGFDAHLTKPVDLEDIERVIGERTAGPPVA